jgi:dCMP deaminase
MNKKWNKRLMELASLVASWSKDDTQVGALIVDENRIVVSMGYNGIPRGCDDKMPERYVSPVKLLYAEHAERNAIYHAARLGVSVKGCIIFTTMFPCADCTKGMIQSGIVEIVTPKPYESKTWGESFKASLKMLKEAKVKVTYCEAGINDRGK